MKNPILMVLFCLFALVTTSAQAKDKYQTRMESGVLIITEVTQSDPYYEPLNQILPYRIQRKAKKYPDLESFIEENYQQACVMRTIRSCLTWSPIGVFIQVFENEKAAERFAQLDMEVRDPWWAPGVIGIIGFSLSGNKIVEARKLEFKKNGKTVSKDLLTKKIDYEPIIIDMPELFHHILSPEMNFPRTLKAPAVK